MGAGAMTIMTIAMITIMTTVAILTIRRNSRGRASRYNPAITLHVAMAPSTLVQYPLSIANRSSGRRAEADSGWPAGSTWCSGVDPRGCRSVSSWIGQTLAINLGRETVGGRGSGGEAFVPVVQAAYLGARHDLTHGRRVSLSQDGRLLPEREVRP
jgi:hypothetical protein